MTEEIEKKIIEIAQSPETCIKSSITQQIEAEFNVKFHPNTIKYLLSKKKRNSTRCEG